MNCCFSKLSSDFWAEMNRPLNLWLVPLFAAYPAGQRYQCLIWSFGLLFQFYWRYSRYENCSDTDSLHRLRHSGRSPLSVRRQSLQFPSSMNSICHSMILTLKTFPHFIQSQETHPGHFTSASLPICSYCDRQALHLSLVGLRRRCPQSQMKDYHRFGATCLDSFHWKGDLCRCPRPFHLLLFCGCGTCSYLTAGILGVREARNIETPPHLFQLCQRHHRGLYQHDLTRLICLRKLI